MNPRGSNWGKWDLHIHTPASYHWNGGQLFRDMSAEDLNDSISEIINKMAGSDIAAYGIMDYWTFDGYYKIQKYLQEHDRSYELTIFPGMEIRVTAPTDFRLNFHFLLSNRLSDQQLADFKSRLEIRIGKTKRSLSAEALIELARSYGDDKAEVHGFNPISELSEYELWKLGSMTAEITIDSVEHALQVLPEKSAVVILPYDTSDGIADLDWKKFPQTDNHFLKLAAIFEARAKPIIDVIQGVKTKDNDTYFENFQNAVGKPKPVISGSDAHRIEDYGNFPSGKATWIKADPTWAGIRIVLREPQERCCVQEYPTQLLRVKDNQTKYVNSVQITKGTGSDLDEIWFNNLVEFNSGLVAIIGNKGSGKSALADIVGLLGNSSRQTHFPFLSKKQFRQTKENKAKHFWGELTWESKTRVKKNLDEETEPTQLETTNYIPQDYFEIICNELEEAQGSSFDKELKSVVFSHVEVSDRLGKSTIDALVEHKTSEIDQKLSLLRRNLHKVNHKIIEYEGQQTTSHREAVENQLKGKKIELEAFDTTKPVPVRKPRKKSSQVKETEKAITQLEKERSSISIQISNVDSAQGKLAWHISELEKIVERFDLLMKQFNEMLEKSKDELKEVGLDITKLASIKLNKYPIDEKIEELREEKKEIDDKLNPSKKDNLFTKQENIDVEIKKLHDKLDEPNKKYQQYQEELRVWIEKRGDIVGKKSEPDTLRFYEYQLKELDSIPKKLDEGKKERISLIREIHNTIIHITEIYSDLYGPVQEFISSHHLAKGKFNLVFDVSIINTNFQDRFFEWVHRGYTGTFYGRDEGYQVISEVVERYDYSNEDETINFVNEVNQLLHFVNGIGDQVKIKDQLRKDREVIDLYDFIFSLEFLEPRYMLKMGDKELHELSPGEKGTLLLVFYLLIDKSDIPLLIDQPEHNLDNETIYDLLVPAIKEAKQKRQIIVVTHNPNIAVVCDADQIICSSIDKTTGNNVEYLTGSIENPKINNRIFI